MYEATLTNYGLLPLTVERCSYVSDTLTPGEMVTYNIERWETKAQSWETVMNFAGADFCTPVPLSMGNTVWRRAWLWPGQSVSTPDEATGARTAFQKGDLLRFVIVANVTGRKSSFPTDSFTLDEERVHDGVPMRVRH